MNPIAIIGKYYNNLKSVREEIRRQYKDRYLRIRQSLILKFDNGFLVVAKKTAIDCRFDKKS